MESLAVDDLEVVDGSGEVSLYGAPENTRPHHFVEQTFQELDVDELGQNQQQSNHHEASNYADQCNIHFS